MGVARARRTRPAATLPLLLAACAWGCEPDVPPAEGPCGPCDPDATCDADAGTCRCNAHFEGDGRSCEPADECAVAQGGCAADARCTNTPQGPACECLPGYVGDGRSCSPGSSACDPVAEGCSAHAACGSADGAVRCECRPGWRGDGRTCEDVDECAMTRCGANMRCVNEPGSFRCECLPGYRAEGSGCVDVDECSTGGGGCTGGSTCRNLPGSFRCECAQGWSYVDGRCRADNPCLDDNGGCDPHATCTAGASGVTCACKPGWAGDGVACVDLPSYLRVDATFQVGVTVPLNGTACQGTTFSYTWVLTGWHVPLVDGRYTDSHVDAHLDAWVDVAPPDAEHDEWRPTVKLKYVFAVQCLNTLVYDLDTSAGALPQAKVSPLTLTFRGAPRAWYWDEAQNLDQAGAVSTLSGAVTIVDVP